MVVARRDGEAVATAMTFESDGVASLQWVGTVPAARGAGLGAYLTTLATNLAFDTRRVVVHAAGLTDGRTDLPRARLRDDLALRRVRALAAARRGAEPAVALASPCSEAELPSHVGGLSEMLEAVVGHADEAHAEGDRRVPAAVDHPVELVGVEGLEVATRAHVDLAQVAEEHVDALGPNGGDVLGSWP